MKDKLSKRERVELTLNLQEADRVPVFDLMHNPGTIEHYAGEKLTYNNAPRVVGKAIQNSLDLTRNVAFPDKPRIEVKEDGFVYRYEEWTVWLVKRPFSTVKELAEYVKKNIEEIRRSNSEDQWSFMGKQRGIVGRGALAKGYKESFLEKQKLIGDTVLFHDESPVGLDTAMDRAGIELFNYLYADDPELVSQWLEALNEHEIRRVHRVADYKLSPVALPYADIAYKGGLLFFPEFLRKEFFPRLKKLVDAWHEHGIKCIFHSDGDYWEVLDDFVKAGVDGINPVEPNSTTIHRFKWNLKEIKKKYPNLILMGNIDCSHLLPYGTKEEVERAVKQAIDDAAPGGGYILGSSSELHPACKPENCITMIETAKRYGVYEKLYQRWNERLL